MQDKTMTPETIQENLLQESKFLTFRLNQEEYAIPIEYVIEIIGIQQITPLPEMPDFIKGVINLRGKIIPVIDIRLRFGMEERPYDDRTCIIVVRIEGTLVGLIVDSVREVLDIPNTCIEPPPKMHKKKEILFIQGLGKLNNSVKIILDIPKLVYSEELELYNQSTVSKT